jgi:hypothetical protein
MSKFIKYDTTLTDVTAFSGNFDHRELSGRPEFSAGNTYTTIACGFSNTTTFEGYSFDSVKSVLLSCTDNQNPFVSSGSFTNWPISGFTSISTLCDGAVLSPPLSGFLYSNYTLNNYNSMSVTFPQITATGSIDIIPMNAAGYGTLVNDISTTITIN